MNLITNGGGGGFLRARSAPLKYTGPSEGGGARAPYAALDPPLMAIPSGLVSQPFHKHSIELQFR